MNNCGRGFTLYQRKAPSRRGSLLAEGSLQIISAGKLGCLRVGFFQRRDGGRQNPFGVLFLPLPQAAANVRLRRTRPPCFPVGTGVGEIAGSPALIISGFPNPEKPLVRGTAFLRNGVRTRPFLTSDI